MELEQQTVRMYQVQYILSGNGTLALADGSNGGKASNYKITLSSGDHAYTVTQKSLGLSGSKGL